VSEGRPGGHCDPDDLVLSLRGGQDVYAGTARPAFLLTLVSTADVECTVDVGPRALETRITSGRDRIWSTADCVSGAGIDVKQLRRGVPYVRMIQWDRHRSGSHCTATRMEARAGTYVALAYAGALRSPKVVFHLR
jgi:hypothetical protein